MINNEADIIALCLMGDYRNDSRSITGVEITLHRFVQIAAV
jgi:hypothetical protein